MVFWQDQDTGAVDNLDTQPQHVTKRQRKSPNEMNEIYMSLACSYIKSLIVCVNWKLNIINYIGGNHG